MPIDYQKRVRQRCPKCSTLYVPQAMVRAYIRKRHGFPSRLKLIPIGAYCPKCGLFIKEEASKK